MNEHATTTETIRTFSDRLSHLVTEEKAKYLNTTDRKLSDAKIAENIGIKRPAFCKYQKGDIVIGVDTLVKFARYYKVSADYLLGLTDATPSTLTEREMCEVSGLTESALVGLLGFTKTPHPSSDAVVEHPSKPPFSSEDELVYDFDLRYAPEEFEITLPSFDGRDCKEVYQRILPSRNTVINEMLSSESFACFVDTLRNSIRTKVSCQIREKFREIHPYYISSQEAEIDKKLEKISQFDVYESALELFSHLVSAYMDKYSSKIDASMQEYKNAAQDFDREYNEF